MNEREALAFVERDARAIATMGDAIVRIAQRLRERATVEELADSPVSPEGASSSLGSGAGGTGSSPVGGTRALPAAAQADGEEPTFEECLADFLSAAHPGYDDPISAADERRGVAAVRSLMLRARPAPSHALVDALDAARSFVQDVLNSPSAWCGDHKLHTSQHGEAELKYILGLLDAARASLPAAKKEGGA